MSQTKNKIRCYNKFMFNTGDKVKKITDGKVGIVKGSINTANGVKFQVQFDNGEAVYLSEDILQEYHLLLI